MKHTTMCFAIVVSEGSDWRKETPATSTGAAASSIREQAAQGTGQSLEDLHYPIFDSSE